MHQFINNYWHKESLLFNVGSIFEEAADEPVWDVVGRDTKEPQVATDTQGTNGTLKQPRVLLSVQLFI